jgi:hypothetical protein
MARNSDTQTAGSGRLTRATEAVKRFFTRSKGSSESSEIKADAPVSASRNASAPSTSSTASTRTTRRQTDIERDVLNRTYTPPLTSAKASFRSDGRDHGEDQEFAYGVSDERWNDEDRLTNKSGDPRIGTHRRTYEPGEIKAESRD